MRRAFSSKHTALFVASLLVATLIFLTASASQALAQKKHRRALPGGRIAIVVDERLSVLRDAPDFSANLLQRLSRGRSVAVTGTKTARSGGVTFYRVAVTRRTSGWLQEEAVAFPGRAGDDARVLRLVRGSEDFDRLARARIFLDAFPRSPSRPAALLLLGDAAEEAAQKLSREAERRLDEREMEAGGAPVASYYLNYSGLDRYRKQGVGFTFDAATKRFHYDGAAWREAVRRYPRSPEAVQARARLEARTLR